MLEDLGLLRRCWGGGEEAAVAPQVELPHKLAVCGRGNAHVHAKIIA